MDSVYTMYNLFVRVVLDDKTIDKSLLFKSLYPLFVEVQNSIEPQYTIRVKSINEYEFFESKIENIKYNEVKYIKYTKDLKWRLRFVTQSVSRNTIIMKFLNRNAFVIINKKTKVLDIYANQDEEIDGFPVMQEIFTEIVKLLYINHMESLGYILIHGACLEYKGRGILIIGESGAGKTTVLLNLLDEEDSYCISNDSVFLRIIDNNIHAVCLPYFFNIRKVALDLYKDLKISDLLNVKENYINNYNQKITFYHQDIILRNKKQIIIDHLIFPEWNDGEKTYIYDIDREIKLQLIQNNIKSPTKFIIPGLNFKGGNKILLDKKNNLANDLLKLTKSYKMDYGRDLNEFIKREYKNYFLYSDRMVTVEIDRPKGYINKFGNEYQVNYGYVKGVMGGDKEEQDAYIIDDSLKEATSQYVGKLIAIVYREDDVETKWIIGNKNYSKEYIYEKIKFNEEYFDSNVMLFPI